MKLKNKLRRRLLPLKSIDKLNINDVLYFNNIKVGKVLINDPCPFALIKLFDPNFLEFKDQELDCSNGKVKIMNKY